MRDILFSGKTKDGKWVEGDLITTKPNKIDGSVVAWIKPKSILGLGAISTDTGHFAEVIPGTVGQYTGLKDKNDKMIFEGDIATSEIIITGSKNGYRGNYKATLKSEIFYNKENCRYEMRAINVECDPEIRWALFDLEKEHTCYIPKSIEVIENITDNPELLET